MHLSLILLHLAGAAILLLYAVHLVRTGMERAHGAFLRRMLGGARKGHVAAAGGGIVMAVALQSSTAVALLACGFAASGLLTLSVGLALLLGADLGSALVVRVLSLDLGWLFPVCLLVGGIMHLKMSAKTMRETGRMIIGIGFVLLSLRLIGEATSPLRETTMLPAFSSYLAGDYMTAFLLGALFTWLVHSSVASILMVATFTAQGMLSIDAAVPIVLGANVGGGLIAFWLSRGMEKEAQRIPVGNLLFRTAGALLALAIMENVALPIAELGPNAGSAIVNFHVVFNVALVVVCLPLSGLMARLTTRLLPSTGPIEHEGDLLSRRVSALDRSVLKNPTMALASATRELLRMAELVEIMTRPVMDLLATDSREEIARVRKVDEEVNRAHTDIKLYLAEVNRGRMSVEEAQRSIELIDFAINLEHAGDIVARSLLALADERARKNLQFSPEGWDELSELHRHLMQNMQLALNVLLSNDLQSARQLVIEKERMRELERKSHNRHIARLQSGTPESVATSNMHLEVARAFKEMNSLLVTVAYPLLTSHGELLESRLASAG